MNKIENGIIEPAMVVTPFTNYSRKIEIGKNNEETTNYSYCQGFEC